MSMERQFSSQIYQEATQYQVFYPYDTGTHVSNLSNDLKSVRPIENLFVNSGKIDDPSVAELIDIEIPSAKRTTDHKKDGLKFARSLSTIVIRHLVEKSGFIQRILRLNAEALETLIPLLNLTSVSIDELDFLQSQALLKLWSDFKELLSYHKNKKICVVKQEYWDLVFDKKTCVEVCQKIFCGFKETTKSFAIKMLLEDETFSTILARLLYCTSKIIALIATLRDSSERGMSIRNLETVDNFIILMIYPSYFGLYNHRAGKFALECCDKCKICCGKKVPRDFLNSLGSSRILIKQLINSLTQIIEKCSPNDSGAFTRILELAINNF